MMNNKAKKIIKKTFRNNVKLWYKIFSSNSSNPEEITLMETCKAIDNNITDVAFKIRPQNLIQLSAVHYGENDRTGIVIQGPLRKENNFTLNTVQYYLATCPSATVIVSTWTDEEQDYVELIEREGAIVIENEKPKYGGHLNVNYQIVNTLAGLKKAKELNCKYVLKTRTDQCLAKPNIISFFLSLIQQFPPQDISVQNSRLLCLSQNYGNMFYPYLMSDFLYFGDIDEVIRVFNIPLDDRQTFTMPVNSTRRQCSEKMYAPEVYLLKHYLEKVGCKGDFTVKDYWQGVANNLVCVDSKLVDLVWPKYDNHYCLNRFYGDYFANDHGKCKSSNFDFVNWLNLYNGILKYGDRFEALADEVFEG